MDIFLRLKHWQLFILLMIAPFFVQLVGMTVLVTSHGSAMIFAAFMLIMFLFVGIFFGWLYVLGVNLNKKLPGMVKMNLTKFKWFLFTLVVYMVIIWVFMSVHFEYMLDSGETNSVDLTGGFAVILPLHFFSMFCIFYCLFFIAKSLKAVERQRPVTFSDYAGEFFLIWFFPIGVWIIQPRINKIFEDTLPEKEQV